MADKTWWGELEAIAAEEEDVLYVDDGDNADWIRMILPEEVKDKKTLLRYLEAELNVTVEEFKKTPRYRANKERVDAMLK